MRRLLVKEIFGPTIQGEGTRAGSVVKFVRLAGCNRWSGSENGRGAAVCSFCDTDFVGGERLTPEEIVARLDAIACPTRDVVVTGGEPLLQIRVDFVKVLFAARYRILLETNGSLPLAPEVAHYISHVTMSPKQRRSATLLTHCDDLKILWPPVLPGVTVEAFADMPRGATLIQPIEPLHLPEADRAAAWKRNIDSALAECLRTGARLSLQTHKVVGAR